jgi:hypothetical protein
MTIQLKLVDEKIIHHLDNESTKFSPNTPEEIAKSIGEDIEVVAERCAFLYAKGYISNDVMGPHYYR